MQCVERNPIKDTLVLIMSDKRAIHWWHPKNDACGVDL